MQYIFFFCSLLPNAGLGMTLGYLIGTSNGNSGFYYPFYGMCTGLFLWIALYFYFDAILPNEYGIRKNLCFCFGCCKKKKLVTPQESFE